MLNITVWGLALGQALLITGNILLVSVTALIGQSMAPDYSWATLPVALQFLGLMGVTLPAALLMGWLGRKKGFLCGNLIGVVGALLAYFAVKHQLFGLFCSSTFLLGMAIGIGQQYRFAATENAPKEKGPQAISLIMGAGVIAAILGPNMAVWFEHWAPDTHYLGAFAALLVLYVINTFIIALLPLKPPVSKALLGTPTPYKTLLKKPQLIGAFTAGAIGYAVMVLVMTATPLAMQHSGFHFGSTASVIQWHVLGMFLPSFITGKLISRFGTYPIIQLGCVLLLSCVLLNQLGITYWHFLIALVALGIGWNFTFIGATTLLTRSYLPEDRARVQGLNDLLVFSSAAFASLLAGYWHSIFGWEILNLLMIPAILMAMFTLMSRRRRAVIIAGTTEPLNES
ncbi:MFS transporter [Marinomonas ostreistagni]|uniref:MFS transporter n=1 Tax=Marinomonas ostreistagni TaxID=359209 RepID=UPI00194FDFCA|nr:MFS transporter [Marinomonas ostreistagni]MBM6551361.1 MFS transporter [Marinomonas ostreistagni]